VQAASNIVSDSVRGFVYDVETARLAEVR